MLAVDDHGLWLRERTLKRRWRTAFFAIVFVWSAVVCLALMAAPEPTPRVCSPAPDAGPTPIPRGAGDAPRSDHA